MIPYSKLCCDHDRSSFDCGSEPLNIYLRERAGQDVRRNLTNCYVVCDADSKRVIAYMTLSNCSIDSKLLGYPYSSMYAEIPMIKLGRLAVDKAFKGQGIGTALLMEAIRLSGKGPGASCGIVVDAKDHIALAWYLKQGLQLLRASPPQCFALLPSLRRLPSEPET